ncbi:MAG: hypothetical protein ACJ77O_12855 [Chloroflexota bacterium]
MTESRSDDLLRRMLERRAVEPPPGWLLASISRAVHGAPPSPARPRPWWQPRHRSGQVVLIAASVTLLLALVVGALVAGGLITRNPKSPLPADVVLPSASPIASPDPSSPVPSASVRPPNGGVPNALADVVGSAWTLPAGWHYDLVCDEDVPCRLHLYDASGGEQDGWPVVIPGDCISSSVAVGSDDSAFVACNLAGAAVVTGLDEHGKPLHGWPVKVKGAVAPSTWNDLRNGDRSPEIAVGPDKAVYVAVARKGHGSYAIHAFAPDGTGRKGWPVSLDGGGQGFAVALNGSVVAWWYEGYLSEIGIGATRTVFTEIGPGGKVLPGWPKGSVGAASGPVVWKDGSIFYTSASGKVWGHDRTGKIIEGWPHALPEPVAPSLRADGTISFIGESRVDVLDRRGKAVPGWPYRPKGSFMGPGCETGGYSAPLARVALDGRLFIAVWDGSRSDIVALGADGSTTDAWPYHVAAGWRVTDIGLMADGTVEAGVATDPCGVAQYTTMRFTSQGTLLTGGLPTSLNDVYEAMRLDGLRTTSGNGTFVQGAQIDFEVGLVNQSNRTIVLPYVESSDSSGYLAGQVQTSIEQLGAGPTLTCLSDDENVDEDDRYATGEAVIVSREPMTIPPGGRMPPVSVGLSPEVTACLPAGDYRYRVEYEQLGDVGYEAIDRSTFDIRITAAGPVATPAPTATPTPTPTTPPRPTAGPTLPPAGPSPTP